MYLSRPNAVLTMLSLLLAGGGLAAGPVPLPQAREAAASWLQRRPPMLSSAGAFRVQDQASRRDSDGQVLFHVVQLEPEGFMVLSADDRLEPVLAFSAKGRLPLEGFHPLLDILDRDTARMRRVVEASGAQPRREAAFTPQARWRELLGQGGILEASGLGGISEVRVDPLVGSRWNQGAANDVFTYNYFVPNHYPAGCVATALAQLMRFHSWPVVPVGPKPFVITVDGRTQSYTLRGGDGLGGAYDWKLMPLVPAAATTDAERRMIGSLVMDAAASVNMLFTPNYGESNTLDAAKSLRGPFLYGNAIQGHAYDGDLTVGDLNHMVLPNLDAGLPVLLGIRGKSGGHAVVCDGYGLLGSTLYHHLNMGWGGASDAWYWLPTIEAEGNLSFNMVHKCVYNVFPTGKGEALSGRVLDAAGAPVADATVTNGAISTTTNSRGIFALTRVVQGWQTIVASKAGLTLPSASVNVVPSVDAGAVGNRWGVNLVQGQQAPTVLRPPANQEVKVGMVPQPFWVDVAGTPAFHYAWKKNGVAAGGDSPSLSLAAPVTRSDRGTTLAVTVTNDHGSASGSGVLSVVDLWNPGFERGLQGWETFHPDMYSGASSDAQPHGGSVWLYMGNWDLATTDWARQTLTIPDTATVASISFWLGIKNSASTPSGVANTFTCKVLDGSLAPLATLATQNNQNQALGSDGTVTWKELGPFNLLPYKGRTVTLQFESVQAGGDRTGTVFAVDDVETFFWEQDPGQMNFQITPSAKVVAAGASQVFGITGESGPWLDWSVTGGLQVLPGRLSASVSVPATLPIATQAYTLTATSRANLAKRATATLTVKGGDLSADGVVDLQDLLVLAAEYGKGSASNANFKGEGTVNDLDLATLLRALQ